jgi:protein SCO1/2
MSKKRLFYILFFAAIAVGFFVVMTILIPGYAKQRVPPISEVRPFSFINQDGQQVTEAAIRGKVAVVNFFFTTCKSVCPKMNNNLKPVYREFLNEPGLIILSHTSDPEVDSPAVLRHYADSLGVDTRRWMFLTGRKDSLYRAARLSYKIDDPNNNVADPDDDFLHTQFIALINKRGEVVKIYDGLKTGEVADMYADIRKLLAE